MSLTLTITAAGRAAITNAENNGTLPLIIDEVAIGSGLWNPDETATGLQNEIKRLDAVKGGNPAPDQLYAEILDESDEVYTLGEFGFYWSDGTLLAIYSQTTPIQEKTADVPLLLSADIGLTSVPANALSFGDTNFRYPSATEATKGVAKIAPQQTADDGEDDSMFITALKMWRVLTKWFARTDIRPIFKKGIDTDGKPVKFGGGTSQFQGIRFDDSTDQPGTFHLVADGDPDETDEGNSFLKIGGVELGSGAKVTGVSDSATSSSTSTLATSKAVKTARDNGTRQATEDQKGQSEIATQAEVNDGKDNSRFIVPKKLHVFLESLLNNYIKKSGDRMTGRLYVPNIRANKGVPTSDGTNAGFAFEEDGDTGLFATEGDDFKDSDLMLFIDSVEVARFQKSGKNLGSNGWVKLTSGLIVQWGTVTCTNSEYFTENWNFTLPISFPNSCLHADAVIGNSIPGSGELSLSVEHLRTGSIGGFVGGVAGTRTLRIFALGH